MSGRFPSSWKCAKVTYLFKQGDRIELIQINSVWDAHREGKGGGCLEEDW